MTRIKNLLASAERSFVMNDEGIWAWGNLKFSSRMPEGADPASWCAPTSAQVGHHRYAQEMPVSLNLGKARWRGILDVGSTLLVWNEDALYALPPEVQEGDAPALRAIPTNGLPFEQFWSGAQTLYGRTADGQLYGWVSVRNGSSKTVQPQRIHALQALKSMSAGAGHVLAIDGQGHLWTWGANAAGQLGLGHLLAQPQPQRVAFDMPVREVAAGETHSLALDAQGQLWGWGSNHLGQISDKIPQAYIPLPQRIPMARKYAVQSLHAGMHVSAAVTRQGKVWTWGSNSLGQLGQQHPQRSTGVHEVAGLPEVSTLSVGATHMLALDRDGACWAWGDNRHGACQAAQAGQRMQLQPHKVRVAQMAQPAVMGEELSV